MSTDNSNLSDLLNDDSFICWVKRDDCLSDSEKEKWDLWLSSNEKNERLLRKAKKIIDMPFKEKDGDSHPEELQRLKEALRKRDDDYQG